MADLIGRALHRLNLQLPGRVFVPGHDRYATGTAIWAKSDHTPRAVVRCLTTVEVQAAIRAARSCDLPLSVRGGGHDWAGRALCDGLVIDLSGMNRVDLYLENGTARVGGGTRASGLLEAIEPFGMAAVTGSCGPVGMAGLALGGGYGPLIGRYGLALDNLLSVEVVLSDGRIVNANKGDEQELFWALRWWRRQFRCRNQYALPGALPAERAFRDACLPVCGSKDRARGLRRHCRLRAGRPHRATRLCKRCIWRTRRPRGADVVRACRRG